VEVEAITDIRTPLHQASQAGAAKPVELLMSRNADASAKDKQGLTPLNLAEN